MDNSDAMGKNTERGERATHTLQKKQREKLFTKSPLLPSDQTDTAVTARRSRQEGQGVQGEGAGAGDKLQVGGQCMPGRAP